jgi:hypothetical protein
MRAMPSIIRLFTCMLLLVAAQVAAQPQLDSLTSRFTRYRTAQEKIYLHHDRSLYVTGETMWFKLYYTDATLHRPLDLSKVAYVELVDDNQQAVLQTKVELYKNGGSGSLFIPATLVSGNYTLRAYTAWMKNFSADLYFHGTVTVINPFRTPELERTATPKPPDAQFFPEGGNLVNGIKSKIAFRITDTSGKGIDGEGVVLNTQNETVATFKPQRYGIGHFYLTPAEGTTYRAVLKDAAGKTYNYKLPDALPAGYVLAVDQQSIKIRSSQNTTPLAFLFIHTRQMIQRAEMITLQNGEATVTLNRQQLPEGITHITLFDGTLNPVCERLVFKAPQKKLTLTTAAERPEYGLRQRVNVDLSAAGSPPAPLHASVAVYKVDSLPAATASQNIASYFWLTSDLKGQIEAPEYYFDLTDSLATQAADNLMLTHGWRRFAWKDALTGKPVIQFIPEHKGHIIEALVTNQAGNPAPLIQTYLSAPGKIIRLYGSRSAQTGKTRYEMREFYGNHKVVLQTHGNRDSVNTITLINPFSQLYAQQNLPALQLPAAFSQALLEKTVAMQVQDVYTDEKNSRILNAVQDSTTFYGKPDETYLLDDYTRFQVMEEVMREYVPGVLVRKRKDGFHFVVMDRVNTGPGVLRDDPIILLDGVPIFDADEIMAFDPLKIKKLDVLTRQYYLGIMVMQGVVSYSTYHGDLGGFPLNPRALVLDYEGLQINREFYSPVYDDKKTRSSRVPDQRSLLYWNPDVTLTGSEAGKLSFYTSDLPGSYRIEVQALTEDGTPASTSAAFSVKRFDN